MPGLRGDATMSTTTSPNRTDVDGADGPDAPKRRVGPSWMHRRRLVTLLVAAVVVVVLFATWLVAFSTAFGVRTVSVRGLHSLTTAEVDGRANVKHGTPLVRVDTAAITARVESLPEVASAEVSTSFPSTVVITVIERTPVGYVADGSSFRLLDRTGDAYRAVSAKPAGLPRLVVAIGSGSAARSTRRAVAHVAAALAALPAAMRPQIQSIQALAPDAITLVLTRQRVVQWGTATRDADKARVLPIMLRKNAATQFDVSDPDRPFSS